MFLYELPAFIAGYTVEYQGHQIPDHVTFILFHLYSPSWRPVEFGEHGNR